MRYRDGAALAGLALGLLTACGTANDAPGQARAATGMPNPASVHCRDQGGILELRQQAGGGVIGMCRFPDGRVCEEWAFFRSGACLPPS